MFESRRTTSRGRPLPSHSRTVLPSSRSSRNPAGNRLVTCETSARSPSAAPGSKSRPAVGVHALEYARRDLVGDDVHPGRAVEQLEVVQELVGDDRVHGAL